MLLASMKDKINLKIKMKNQRRRKGGREMTTTTTTKTTEVQR